MAPPESGVLTMSLRLQKIDFNHLTKFRLINGVNSSLIIFHANEKTI